MSSSRWPLAALTLAILVAVTTFAAAPADAQRRRPRLSVTDRGEQVEIVVHDVRLADQPVMKLKGDRIELPLAGLPMESNEVYPGGLVARIDVRGEGQRWMSVKLRRMPSVAAALARGAMARQEDDGVHLFVPKAAPAAGVAVVAPVAAPAPVPARPAGAVAGTTVGIAGATVPPVEEPVVAPAAEAPATPAPADSTAATTTAPVTTTPAGIEPLVPSRLTGTGTGTVESSTAITGGGSGPGFGRVIIALGAIGLVGLAVVLFRRRRGTTAAAPAQQLDVLAARSLGGKTRIVWLAVGDRELVVAVGPQQTNLLGQWRRGEAGERLAAALPTARTESRADSRADRDDEPSFAAGSTQVQVPRTRTNTTNSAVSGLMRLRGRTAAAYAGESAADESDEQWARDILAAGGRR